MSTEIEQKYLAYSAATKKLSTEKAEIAIPNWSENLGPDFFGQRGMHRRILFYFAVIMSALSLLFLIAMIGFQTYYRTKLGANFEVISDQGIQVVAVAIFGQIFGVIYVIANSLWSNHEFGFMLKERRGKK